MEPQSNALALPTNDTLPNSAQWPAGLKRLLTEGEDGGASARLIAINPALKAQAEAMLPALERAKVPAGDEEMFAILVRHATTYALPSRTDGEWRELFDVYLDALNGFSAHAIEDAFLRWNRGEDMKDPAMGQFYPKPAQLVHLANKAKLEVWMAAFRARKALEHVEQQPRELPPEEQAQVREGFQELLAAFKPKEFPETLRPKMTPAQVAERIRRGAPPPAYDDEEAVL
jgi:hypothetical protein